MKSRKPLATKRQAVYLSNGDEGAKQYVCYLADCDMVPKALKMPVQGLLTAVSAGGYQGCHGIMGGKMRASSIGNVEGISLPPKIALGYLRQPQLGRLADS